MLRIILQFACLLLSCIFYGQETDKPSHFITRFPFSQFTGGVVVLKAQLGSYPDSLNFILDTGSGGISLDSTTVKRLGVPSVPSEKTIRGIAGIKKARFVNNQQLRFPHLTVDSLDFHINNYEILTSIYGQHIDGIIGYSVLNRFIIKLDYDSLYIEFWSQGPIKYPRGGHLLRPTITTLPFHPFQIRDAKTIKARFLIDMGAGMNMIFTTDFIRDSGLLSSKRKLYKKEAQGLGGAIDMSITVIKEVRIGPYRFKRVPVYIFDDVYNVTSYPFLGGLLGNDLLRRFNSILNYEQKEFYLRPNSHYKEAFDYSYSGIELYYEENKIIIGEVAKDSPAEKAGLQEGDLVLAIDKSFNQNLQEYKSALQSAQGKVKIIVMRRGVIKQFEVKIKSILKKK